MVAAIDNIRNLPAAALFGSDLIFFFIFSALVFLIPTALVSAELSAAFPDKGGVYQWVNRAFGQRWGMAAIWLQWINTMVWYPTMLSFIAGTFAYLIDPALAQNKFYLISFILVIFWSLTFINMKGLHVSALVNNLCGIIGTILPLIFLIALGAVWYFTGHPLQIELKMDHLIPSFNQTTAWVSLIAIMASFLGMELSGVHVNEIKEPQKNFPKAALIATLFIFLSMTLGSLAIAFVLPGKEINLIAGVMQLFSNFFNAFGLKALTPILTVLLVVGSIGTMINWLISPAKGLLHAAEFGFLPPFFTKKNRAGVAANILLVQAILVTLFCLVFLLEPSVNAFYWFLTALSTELYMIMYILMFCAAIKLRYKFKERGNVFKISKGNLGMWGVSLLGLIGCTMTIVVSFFPPTNVNIASPLRYIYLIIAGNLLTISPLYLFYRYQRKQAIRASSSSNTISG
jgi:glutamate:GABA antiporter